jgi:hypothetical protein
VPAFSLMLMKVGRFLLRRNDGGGVYAFSSMLMKIGRFLLRRNDGGECMLFFDAYEGREISPAPK